MENRISTDTVLHAYGDTELWYVQNPEATWSLPVWVKWRVDPKTNVHYGKVTTAFVPYVSQALALMAILDVHDHEGIKSEWLMYRKMVEAVLHKAPGVTPLYYYKWNDPSYLPPIPATHPTKLYQDLTRPKSSYGFDSFASFITSNYNIPMGMVKIVLRAIAEEGPKWLVNERKVLDLGFCKILAVPFRPNWKEIVHAKLKSWKLLNLFNLRTREKRTALEEAGLPEALTSMDNIALDRGNYCLNYYLEIIPGTKFDKAANTCEMERISSGNHSYIASYEKTVETLYPQLLESLEAYLRKMAKPFATLHPSVKSGLLRLIPTARRKDIDNLPVHIVAATSPFSVAGEFREKDRVRAKAPPLPKVSALPSTVDDVRQCQEQRALAGPSDRDGGATGVPLLDAGQSQDPRESMLPIHSTSDGNSSRVDGE